MARFFLFFHAALLCLCPSAETTLRSLSPGSGFRSSALTTFVTCPSTKDNAYVPLQYQRYCIVGFTVLADRISPNPCRDGTYPRTTTIGLFVSPERAGCATLLMCPASPADRDGFCIRSPVAQSAVAGLRGVCLTVPVVSDPNMVLFSLDGVLRTGAGSSQRCVLGVGLTRWGGVSLLGLISG